jgi:hypothetical protein
MREDLGREFCLVAGQVSEAQSSSGSEHARAFGERARFARRKAENGFSDDLVDTVVREWDRFHLSLERPDVPKAGIDRRGRDALEHRGQEVERDHVTAGTGATRGEDRVDVGAAAKVENRFAPVDVGVAERVRDTQRAVRCELGDLREFLGAIQLAGDGASRAGSGAVGVADQRLDLSRV